MPFTLPPVISLVLDEPDLQIDNELIPGSPILTPSSDEINNVEQVSSPNVPLPSLSNWRQTETVGSEPISTKKRQ
jgi:hypothetical protein